MTHNFFYIEISVLDFLEHNHLYVYLYIMYYFIFMLNKFQGRVLKKKKLT